MSRHVDLPGNVGDVVYALDKKGQVIEWTIMEYRLQNHKPFMAKIRKNGTEHFMWAGIQYIYATWHEAILGVHENPILNIQLPGVPGGTVYRAGRKRIIEYIILEYIIRGNQPIIARIREHDTRCYSSINTTKLFEDRDGALQKLKHREELKKWKNAQAAEHI